MIMIVAALAIGAVIGLAAVRRDVAAVAGAVCAASCHLLLAAVADAAARTPPVFAWEATLASVAQATPVWATALAGAGAALAAGLLANSAPGERAWTPDMPDRRSGTDRRRDARGSDRRKKAWEDLRGGI